MLPVGIGINQVGIGINQVPLMNQDKEVVVALLSCLPGWSIGACSLVCKDWNQLLNSNYRSEKLSVWQQIANIQFSMMKFPDFKSYLQLHSNFTNGMYSLKVLPEAKAPMAMNGSLVFSRSLNETNIIQKWDWKNEQCTGLFEGHASKVSSIAVSKNQKWLFSRSVAGTIKKWNVKDCTCLATCEDLSENMHVKKIFILVASDKFFTNSADGTIKIWDIETCLLTHTIPCTDPLKEADNAKSYVSSWAIDENEQRLFAGYTDGRIRIWSLIDLISCIATREPDPGNPGVQDSYSSVRNSIGPMVVKGNEVFFSCRFTSRNGWLLKRWNCENNTSQTLLGLYANWGRPIAIQGDILISGFGHMFKDVRICKIDSLIRTYGVASVLMRIHNTCMRELYVENGVIFSSSDTSVKILDCNVSHSDFLKAIAKEIVDQDAPVKYSKFSNYLEISIKNNEGNNEWEEYGVEDPWQAESSESCSYDDSDIGSDSDSENENDLLDPAIKRFSRLPLRIKNAIIENLNEILRRDIPGYNGSAEDSLYGKSEQSATPGQIAEAINMYLNGQSSL